MPYGYNQRYFPVNFFFFEVAKRVRYVLLKCLMLAMKNVS